MPLNWAYLKERQNIDYDKSNLATTVIHLSELQMSCCNCQHEACPESTAGPVVLHFGNSNVSRSGTFEFDQVHVTKNQPIIELILSSESLAI